MILTILKSYWVLLLSVGMSSLFIFMLGLYFIFRKAFIVLPKIEMSKESYHNDHDLSAITGDDIMTTQLDLARAYLETDRKSLAIQILKYVIQKGNSDQQHEAQQLMNDR